MKQLLFLSLLCGCIQASEEQSNKPLKVSALLTTGYLHTEQNNIIAPELDYVAQQLLQKKQEGTKNVSTTNPFDVLFNEMTPKDFNTCISDLDELIKLEEAKEKKK